MTRHCCCYEKLSAGELNLIFVRGYHAKSRMERDGIRDFAWYRPAAVNSKTLNHGSVRCIS